MAEHRRDFQQRLRRNARELRRQIPPSLTYDPENTRLCSSGRHASLFPPRGPCATLAHEQLVHCSHLDNTPAPEKTSWDHASLVVCKNMPHKANGLCCRARASRISTAPRRPTSTGDVTIVCGARW